MRATSFLLLSVCATSHLGAQAPGSADSARHVLNRLAFGPGPGQIDAVAKEGVLAWTDRALSPSRPPDAWLSQQEQAFSPGRFEAAALSQRMEAARRQRRNQGDSGP
jgi:hypothetical protein